MEAEIILDCDNAKMAEAIGNAVSPDNIKVPSGLSVRTTWKDGRVISNITCERGILSFIATIDDLLFCISTAEKTVHTTKKLE